MREIPTLPLGWRYEPLGRLIQSNRPITYGVVQPGDHDPDGVPLVRGTDFSFGWRPLGEMRRVSPEIERKFSRARLCRGDLVITIKGDVGKTAEVPDWLEGANLSQTNARLAIDDAVAAPRYILHFLRSHWGRFEVYRNTKVGAQPGLIFEDIASFAVPLPPTIADQNAVVAILDTWDEAIEKADRLMEAKTKAFEHWSLMLLSGRKRLGSKRSNWQSVALTDVTTEATVRNAGSLGKDVVMGVSKYLGMIPMKDHIRASDLSRYKVVSPEAFAYNPMRLNIGSIAQNLLGREVLVSPDYVAFETQPDALLPAYFDHLRRSWLWSRFVKSAGSGGVRIRIYYDDLADFVFELPPVPEQQRIVDVLDTSRREIALLEKHRDALAKQKRGLMQKLLTGEWALPVSTTKEAAE